MFTDVSISGFSDIVQAIKRNLQEPQPSSHRHLLDLLWKMLIRQQEILEGVTGKYQTQWHSRFDGSVVELVCKRCQVPTRPDSDPRWAVSRPGYYVARERRCNSPGCRGRKGFASPVDKSMLYLARDPASLYMPPRQMEHFDFEIYTRQPGIDVDNCPSMVECWCIRCKELTELSDGSSSWTDTQARWTIGTPMYVERPKACLRCYREV